MEWMPSFGDFEVQRNPFIFLSLNGHFAVIFAKIPKIRKMWLICLQLDVLDVKVSTLCSRCVVSLWVQIKVELCQTLLMKASGVLHSALFNYWCGTKIKRQDNLCLSS